LVLDEAKLADRSTEGAPVPAPLDRNLEDALAYHDSPGCEVQARAVEHLHRHFEAAPRLAQHVLGGDDDVVERHFCRGASADAELVGGVAAAHAGPPFDH